MCLCLCVSDIESESEHTSSQENMEEVGWRGRREDGGLREKKDDKNK